MFASAPATDQSTMSQVSSTAKLKCAQLQIPSASASNSQSKSEGTSGASVSKCFRSLFEESLDRLKEYIDLTSHYRCRVKSFSTADILGQTNCESESVCAKKYLSECDLATYGRHHSSKEITNDYITYSCSTLAICGDTMHSSQLPSPQTQSIRQINSLIFSDLDFIKSVSKKVRNLCINQRMSEFLKSVNVSTMAESEVAAISKLTSDVIAKPIKLRQDLEQTQFEGGDILIHVIDCEADKDRANSVSNCVTKHDKQMFVLNWLQTVEAGPEFGETP